MTSIDRDTVAHVRASWAEIEKHASQLGALFYDHLFTADPTLVSLFGSNARGEMGSQGDKLMQMLGIAVDEMDNPSMFIPALQSLGRRHVGYGVEDEHYALVGDALMKTLAQGLGERFTPEVEQAWATTYTAMTDVMIAASHPARSPA